MTFCRAVEYLQSNPEVNWIKPVWADRQVRLECDPQTTEWPYFKALVGGAWIPWNPTAYEILTMQWEPGSSKVEPELVPFPVALEHMKNGGKARRAHWPHTNLDNHVLCDDWVLG